MTESELIRSVVLHAKSIGSMSAGVEDYLRLLHDGIESHREFIGRTKSEKMKAHLEAAIVRRQVTIAEVERLRVRFASWRG